MEELLSAHQVAEILGVNWMTVLEWSRKGYIPSYKFSRKKVRFIPSEVEAWVKQQKREVK